MGMIMSKRWANFFGFHFEKCPSFAGSVHFLFSFNRPYFREVLGLPPKIEWKAQRISYPSSPLTQIPSPTMNIHYHGISVTTDEPALAHHYQLNSIFYSMVHSLCCTFYGFGQLYNDMYPSL